MKSASIYIYRHIIYLLSNDNQNIVLKENLRVPSLVEPPNLGMLCFSVAESQACSQEEGQGDGVVLGSSCPQISFSCMPTPAKCFQAFGTRWYVC